ncbi:MAG TPA: hypothetical protein VGM92_02870 [Candidatus Kapabacteria bacterium]|jgi:hypothetical protein
MYRITFFLSIFAIAAGLSSCCQPAHKDANPVMIDSLFQTSYGRDLDFYNSNPEAIDSAYYPIYTFGIQNAGTADDHFTLQFQRLLSNGIVTGFSITRLVPAGQTVLFRTPTAAPDSITSQETFAYFAVTDTIPNIDEIYDGLSFQTTDSAKIQSINPSLTIVYGSIDNGPEGCNTPASVSAFDINTLPVR